MIVFLLMKEPSLGAGRRRGVARKASRWLEHHRAACVTRSQHDHRERTATGTTFAVISNNDALPCWRWICIKHRALPLVDGPSASARPPTSMESLIACALAPKRASISASGDGEVRAAAAGRRVAGA